MSQKERACPPGCTPDGQAKENESGHPQAPKHIVNGEGHGVNDPPGTLKDQSGTGLSRLGQAALDYAAAGVPVFPLVPGTKVPFKLNIQGMSKRVGGGQVGGLKLATTDPRRITEWWTAHSDANIGAPTGSASGFCVLDMDSAKAWLFVCEQGFPSTAPRVIGTAGNHDGATGKGHVYFRCDGAMKSSSKVAGVENLELLADGKYALLPPSIHPNGREYAWQGPSIIEQRAPAPPEWLTEVAKFRRQLSEDTGRGRDHPPKTKTRTKTSTSIRSPKSGGRLGGLSAELSRKLRDEETARRLVERCGQRWPGLGEKFCCLMTEERHPSAAIWQASGSGDLLYKDFHGKCLDSLGHPIDCVPLGSVWAAIRTGIIRRLHGAELSAWAIRMLLQLGLHPEPAMPRGLRTDVPDDPDAIPV